MVALIGLLGGFIAKLFSVEVIKFLATKALIASAITFLLPIVLYNLILRIFTEIVTFANSHVVGTQLEGVVINATGLGAWLVDTTGLAACLSLILTATLARFYLRLIGR
jgi:hypothetical protein